MYDRAYEILDYLPQEAGEESVYINHLWKAFEVLIEGDEAARPFAILPFHLLVMFAVQYKVYRASAFNKEKYLTILESCKLRDPGEKRMIAENTPIPNASGIIPGSCSVRNLSLLPEKRLFDFLKPLGFADNFSNKAAELVEIRSTYAHANGNIEEDIELRIDEYIEVLAGIQLCMVALNDAVATDWLSKIQPDDDPKMFVDARVASSFLCKADFMSGLLMDHFLKSTNFAE
jgi:hypothetical protein